jgi:putative endonuclease
MDSIRVSEAPDTGSIPVEATKNLFMFFAYVIKSINHNFYYKGHCENLEKRLTEHNSGMTKSIRPYIPFQIIYFQEFKTREEAINKEKYFKTSAGRRFLKLMLAS